MGHYLIFMVNEERQKKQTRKDRHGIVESYFVEESSTIIFVIDLQDNSVQEITTEERLILTKDDVLIKCNENQILILGGSQTDSDWIMLTIDSFDRNIHLWFKSLIFCKAFDWETKVLREKGNRPLLDGFTAQISKEVLYVYGHSSIKGSSGFYERELWSLNLSNMIDILYFISNFHR